MSVNREMLIRQMFGSFYWTLHHICEELEMSDEFGPMSLKGLLSDMCPYTFADGESADPACYAEYKEMFIKDPTEPEDGFGAAIRFLHTYQKDYGYELGNIEAVFRWEDYLFAYEFLSKQ